MEGSRKLENEFIKHCNFWRDNVEGVNDCLSRDVDVNTTNEYGRTGLMLACKRGNTAIVSRLVQVRLVHLDVEDCSEELLRQQSYVIKNQLGHPKPPNRGFGTQKKPLVGILLAPRWFFMA